MENRTENMLVAMILPDKLVEAQNMVTGGGKIKNGFLIDWVCAAFCLFSLFSFGTFEARSLGDLWLFCIIKPGSQTAGNGGQRRD
ncbi:MAG: hypothetical protein ACI3YD_02935, partial [Alloprevotella sp.]